MHRSAKIDFTKRPGSQKIPNPGAELEVAELNLKLKQLPKNQKSLNKEFFFVEYSPTLLSHIANARAY